MLKAESKVGEKVVNNPLSHIDVIEDTGNLEKIAA